jgi:hypothetical protein
VAWKNQESFDGLPSLGSDSVKEISKHVSRTVGTIGRGPIGGPNPLGVRNRRVQPYRITGLIGPNGVSSASRLSENADQPVAWLGLSAAKEPGFRGLERRFAGAASHPASDFPDSLSSPAHSRQPGDKREAWHAAGAGAAARVGGLVQGQTAAAGSIFRQAAGRPLARHMPRVKLTLRVGGRAGKLAAV